MKGWERRILLLSLIVAIIISLNAIGNCCTLLKLVCKVVIGQCNQTVGCNQTTVSRQFY